MEHFVDYLGSAFNRLGHQVASGVASHLDGVAVSVGQALRERGIAGGAAQRSSSASSSSSGAAAAGVNAQQRGATNAPGSRREEVPFSAIPLLSDNASTEFIINASSFTP